MPKTAFLIVLFFIGSMALFAQQIVPAIPMDTVVKSVPSFTETDVQPYAKDKAYNYIEIESDTSLYQKVKAWIVNRFNSFMEWLFGVEKATGYLSIFFKTLPYVLLVGLVLLLIKFFLKLTTNKLKNSSHNAAKVYLSEEEQLMQTENLEKLIATAVLQKNYRLAVRYHYVAMLKALREGELIVWRQQKTNAEYTTEIANTPFLEDFKQLTKLYEYSWYGDFSVSETQFKTAEIDFNAIKNQVVTHA